MTYVICADNTDFIYASIKEVMHTFVEALLIVALIVYIFLQNWRSTLIPMIAVPVSLLVPLLPSCFSDLPSIP